MPLFQGEVFAKKFDIILGNMWLMRVAGHMILVNE